LLGAAGGEALFRGARVEPEVRLRRNVCLVFDQSESMAKRTAEGPTQLEALRAAAQGFLVREELAHDRLSLVGFSDEAELLCTPTDASGVAAAFERLRARGRTDIGRGLETARAVLAAAGAEERWILLFTDGKPQTGEREDPTEAARRAARACREAGIRIVCVGTGLAERGLLAELADDPAHVFVSNPGALGSAFERSAELIESRQMLASQPASVALEASLVRACGWSALVALGTGLALLAGHARHLHRRPRWTEIGLALLGAALSGLLAGALGQGAFYALARGGVLEPSLRAAAWILLGGGLVLGMSFFVPNLPRGRALVGGALGGAAAVTAFLRIVPHVGDAPGRLLGALLLGFLAGSTTVLVEASVRRAWLVVRWPGGETSRLLLGKQPIVVGHSARADVCPVFDETRAPVVGLFTHAEGRTRFEDRCTGKVRSVHGGEQLAFDPIVIEVHEERGERNGGPRPRTAPEPRPGPEPALPRTRPERTHAHAPARTSDR
jgi:Ca-activated chloride channel family protein